MAIVEPLSYDMIRAGMKERGWKVRTDEDGDFFVSFSDDGVCPDLDLIVTLSGEKKEVLGIMLIPEGNKVPKERWPKALLSCNEWNRDNRWPNVCLNIREGEDKATIIAKCSVDCEYGIHKEFAIYFIRVMLAYTTKFWEWAINNNKL